jgi:hypothetical protein
LVGTWKTGRSALFTRWAAQIFLKRLLGVRELDRLVKEASQSEVLEKGSYSSTAQPIYIFDSKHQE